MPTIVWDVDDVLNDLARKWLDSWLVHEGSGRTITYEDLVENPPHRLLGIPLEEYLASLDRFRLSEEGSSLPPLPEVSEWFREHGADYRHVALTATPLCAAPLSAAWVVRHFGEWIRTFGFVPSPRRGEALAAYDTTKAEYLGWLDRADVLVDDSLSNLKAAETVGVRTVTVPRPWNGEPGSVRDALERLTGMLDAGGGA